MIQKPFVSAIGFIVLLVILVKLNVFNALLTILLILLIGGIPGTNYSIPSSIMLLIAFTTMWLLLFYAFTFASFYKKNTKRPVRAMATRTNNMPKRRYKHVSTPLSRRRPQPEQYSRPKAVAPAK